MRKTKPKTTKPKTTTTKPKTTAPKRTGLQPQSALGRALLTMVYLFLGEEALGVETRRDETRQHLLVHGFLERSQYSVDYATIAELQRDIEKLLLLDSDERDDAAREEARKLAAGLVDEVFLLGHTRLKELVPAALAAVGREATAAAQQKAAQRKAKASGAKAKKTTARREAKASGAKAKKTTASAGKGSAKKGREAKASGAGKASERLTRPSRGMPKGVDDPAYGKALLVLRDLGRNVDDAYASDELEDQLNLPRDRAEAILAAARTRGDWPPGGSSSGKVDGAEQEPEHKPEQEQPEKGSGDPLVLAALRLMADAQRQGKKVTASTLKKALGVGHARAVGLLEAAKETTAAAAA